MQIQTSQTSSPDIALAPECSMPSVEWTTPGSALHYHLQLRHLSGGAIIGKDPANQTPSTPKTPSQAQQRPRLTSTNRAERGPRFAFGGKLKTRTSQISQPAISNLDGPSGKSVGRDNRLTNQNASDSWLGGWQPREKLASAETRTPKAQKPQQVLLAPALDWKVPQASEEGKNIQKNRGAHQSNQRPSNPLPQMSSVESGKVKPPLPSRSKGSQPHAVDRDKAEELQSNKQSELQSNSCDPSPKWVAMKKLANLRDARKAQNSRKSITALPEVSPDSTAFSAFTKSKSRQSFTPRSALTSAQSDQAQSGEEAAATCILDKMAPEASEQVNKRASIASVQERESPSQKPRTSFLRKAKQALRGKVSLLHGRSLSNHTRGEDTRESSDVQIQSQQAVETSITAPHTHASLAYRENQRLASNLGSSTSSRNLTSLANDTMRRRSEIAPQARPVLADQTSNAERMDADGGLEQEGLTQERVQCNGCGRSFAPAAFSKHTKICAKVFKAARAAYAAKQNNNSQPGSGTPGIERPSDVASGTSVSMGEIADSAIRRRDGLPARGKQSKAEEIGKKQKVPKWKQESAQLRAAMLAAQPKKMGQAAASFPGAVMEAEFDARVPCPHCGRKFAELTAERHIPKCKETRNKASLLKAGGGKAAHMRQPGQAMPGRKW